MTINAVQREIDRIDDQLNAMIEKLADDVRTSVVLPICRKHRLTFIAGMGTYAFYNAAGDNFGSTYAPKYLHRVFAIMDQLLPTGLALGAYINDVQESDWSKTA